MKSLRERVLRASFGEWQPAHDRPDPLGILEAQERERIHVLIPVRRQRMLASPFAFYRGGAAIMAADLANVAVTGIRTQLCGDAHVANFGIFATPERNIVFDVNDFDETLPGPWEWDVMRLCASLPLAAREAGLRKNAAAEAVYATTRSYQQWMRRYASQSPLDVWYARIDVEDIVQRSGRRNPDWQRALDRAQGEHAQPHFGADTEYFRRLDAEDADRARNAMLSYAASLLPSIRVLFERYELVDLALKVVGVGSVGTLCLAALMHSDREDRLVLQLKEAQSSVLEAYLPPSVFDNHAQRVVNGQRLMQAASDVFLGWVRFDDRDLYVRQLNDGKAAVDLTRIQGYELVDYGARCGWALARAHARSGDGRAIAAYLGRNDEFAKAMVRFATTYAAQVDRDYDAFRAANNVSP
ncbi:MAG: DUF2252 domain-containing protein [Candidatus Eremiobacteraeota bacterium]|nr:DUF2252 domain-containing protein [Candidatus Eremiobacteraeota bacterium]